MSKRRKANPVTISYLPGFEAPPPEPLTHAKTKFPFKAWINGRPVMVHGFYKPAEYLDDVWFGDPEDRDDKWLTHGLGFEE